MLTKFHHYLQADNYISLVLGPRSNRRPRCSSGYAHGTLAADKMKLVLHAADNKQAEVHHLAGLVCLDTRRSKSVCCVTVGQTD
jgi:hypothetical protein